MFSHSTHVQLHVQLVGVVDTEKISMAASDVKDDTAQIEK